MKLFRQVGLSLSEQAHKSRGQAIVLVAFVFIGLIAFTGLVVDVASLLTRYSQLRRALDAAGVQAANQFRESRDLYNTTGGDLFSAVQQIMAVQGFSQPETRIRIFACPNPGAAILDSRDNSSPGPPGNGEYDEGALKDQLCLTPPRKLVRVDAQSDVGLPFLSIVGWRYVTLKVTSVGEAASIDVALVLDRSASMARLTCSTSECLALCPVKRNCYPFEDVRANAKLLVQRLKFPYDHVAIIQFDRTAQVFDTAENDFVDNPATIKPTMMINDRTTAENVLDNFFSIQTGNDSIGGMEPDTTFTSGLLQTNIGGGIRTATRVLTVQGRRRASVWMTVFLTDGAPNATDPIGNFSAGACPPTSWPDPSDTPAITITGYTRASDHVGQAPYAKPLCTNVRTAWPIARTCMLTGTLVDKCPPGANIKWSLADPVSYAYHYDPDDYARDQADYMASNGIVAFVIGLGPLVTEAPNQVMAIPPPDPNPSRDPDAGERLLRYIADMGYDPDVKDTKKQWLCRSNWAWDSSVSKLEPPGTNCGNYWYAATGPGLKRVFEEIASRMFTRLQE